MPFRVAIRVDASLVLASGHVMRCLTLAHMLRAQGAECRFVCRAVQGHMVEKIRCQGFFVTVLPYTGPVVSSFLPVSQAQDAQETIEALGGWPPHWLVVDHYGLNANWEGALRGHCARLMVIDDYTDRPHLCDVLLNQNLGVLASEYAHGVVPSTCKVLAGTDYALLRAEFAAARPMALARRMQGQSHGQILVSLGGVDADNVTAQVLSALAVAKLPAQWAVTVVMGGQAPHLAAVQGMAGALPFPVRIVVDTNDIAQLMLEADLAIGAAGSTSWERCVMALPSIIMVLAENQAPLAAALAQAGAAISVRGGGDATGLIEAVDRLIERADLRHQMAMTAARLVDGNGAGRVVAVMLAQAALSDERTEYDNNAQN